MKNQSNPQASSTNATTTEQRPARRGVFIPMDEEQHRSLKVRAAQSGSTLQNLVGDLLSDALAKSDGPTSRRGRETRVSRN